MLPSVPPTPNQDEASLADDESLVELRCSVIVVSGRDVLVLRRSAAHGEELVLPGGRPRPGEGMLACARREVLEETGLDVAPDRCAFVAEVIAPEGPEAHRQVELFFVSRVAAKDAEGLRGEEGAEPLWLSVSDLRQRNLRPPVAGYLSGVVAGMTNTAPYLGNLWRPDRTGDTT